VVCFIVVIVTENFRANKIAKGQFKILLSSMRSDPEKYAWLFDNIVSIIIGKGVWKRCAGVRKISKFVPPNCEAYALWAVENFWDAAYFVVIKKDKLDEASMVSVLNGAESVTSPSKDSLDGDPQDGSSPTNAGGPTDGDGGAGATSPAEGDGGEQPQGRVSLCAKEDERPKYTTRTTLRKTNERWAGVKVGKEGLDRWKELIDMVKNDREKDKERCRIPNKDKEQSEGDGDDFGGDELPEEESTATGETKMSFDTHYMRHWNKVFASHEMPSKKRKRETVVVDDIPNDMEDEQYDLNL